MAFNIMSDMKSIRFPHPVADAMARTILESSKTATWRVVKPPALDKMIVADNGECNGKLHRNDAIKSKGE